LGGVQEPSAKAKPPLVQVKLVQVKEWIVRAPHFLAYEVWNLDLEPRTWPARGLAFVQFGVMVGQGFVRDQLMLRASALTYFTVLSLIPLLAIATSIAAAVGVTSNIASLVVERFAAGDPDAEAKILALVEQANFRGLGALGAAVLFLTTVLGIGNIERALNHLWGVKQQRTLGRRFTDYLAVLVLAPLLLGIGLSLETTLSSQAALERLFEVPGFELLYNTGLQQMPTVMLALAFGFLYWFLPNTTVRPFAAFLGGLVAGVLVNLALGLYLGFGVGAAKANALFGSFAQLPLLFVWMYVFWAIVLLGAEVAFAYQTLPLYRREVRGRTAGPSEREAICLRIALEVGRAFRDGADRWTPDELSDELRVPVRTVRDVVSHLQSAGILSGVGPADKPDAVQLGRPAEAIAVTGVLEALRGEREPLNGESPPCGVAEQVLEELREGESRAAAGRTLGDLLAALPVRTA